MKTLVSRAPILTSTIPALTTLLQVPPLLAGQLSLLQKQLLRHARLAVYDHSLAEDLVQDTLVVVIQRHTERRGEASLLTWAVAILRHKVADWYRSPDRRRMLQVNVEDNDLDGAIEALHNSNASDSDPVPAWQQPENREEQRQMMSVLDRCIGCLPSQIGRVFVMREWLGFETTEIGERLCISQAHCRTILHRARMALRACMQRDWLGKAEHR